MASEDRTAPFESAAPSVGTPRCSVLIVDDEPVIGQVLAMHLRSRGFETTEVQSAAGALAVARKFTLGVFDIDLGDGNGVDVAEALLQRRLVLDAVFYSGTLDDEVRSRASKLGTFVSKTIGIQAVVRTVEARAGRRASGVHVAVDALDVSDG